MKVIFFVTTLFSGGLENYLLRFLKHHGKDFKEVIVFCKGGRGGILENQYLEINNVRIVKRLVGTYHPHHYLKLKTWLKQHEDYIVCDFTGNFAGPVLKIAEQAGIKKRMVFYRSSSNRFKETFIRLQVNKYYNGLVLKHATHILANSAYAFDFFFGKNSTDGRFKVVYNGINVEQFLSEKGDLRDELGFAEDTFVIGHTGRYNPAKNHGVILETACILTAKYPAVKFILCGKGVKENLTRKVEEMALTEFVLLFENRSDIPKFLNTCNAYIFPSVTEGQPNALIEAWIKSIPFVASNIEPIKDITLNKFHSYLKDANDAKAMSAVLENILQGHFTTSDQNVLADWAKSEFNAQKRFREFFNAIIK